jgi:hypothetical protein
VPVTHSTGGWVSPRTFLNGHGEKKSLAPNYQILNSGTFIPWRVAIPTTMFYLRFKIIQKPLLIQTGRFNLRIYFFSKGWHVAALGIEQFSSGEVVDCG